MIIIEGLLLTPPDRGSIIGKAAWKSRYIILGSHHLDSKTQNNLPLTAEKISKSRIGLKSTSKVELSEASYLHDDCSKLYLSIFKAKGEWEHIAHYPASEIQTCEIRTLQHRKQSPALPTLAIEFKNDSSISKFRKRRSSRASVSLKVGGTNTLLFRSIEGERHSIYDWVMQIKLLLMSSADNSESITSGVVNYSNPFTSTSKPGSSRKIESRGTTSSQPWTSNPYAHSGKFTDLVSSSPSLRSRRSDLSSQSSSLAKLSGLASSLAHTGGGSDFPSPSSTSGYDHQLIGGWASTPGRTSALSSHNRGSNSINSGTTPGPRETILDRAFQMRYIPGGDMVNSTEDVDKLSSTARFEALMREHDEKKQPSNDINSNRELTSDSNEEDMNLEGTDDSEDDLYTSEHENELPAPRETIVNFNYEQVTTVKQALSPPPKNPAPFVNSEAFSALSGHGSSIENSDGTNSRNDVPLAKKQERPAVLKTSTLSFPSSNQILTKEIGNNQTNNKLDSREARRSSLSAKRLSFQEFARRLSTTSSLLMVQTNASSNSGRISGDSIPEFIATTRNCTGKDERDQRCAWRGSYSAFGVERTFL